MSKGAAQPQKHVCAALRMARAELLHIFRHPAAHGPFRYPQKKEGLHSLKDLPFSSSLFHHYFRNCIEDLVMTSAASCRTMCDLLHIFKCRKHIRERCHLVQRILNVCVRYLLAVTDHSVFHSTFSFHIQPAHQNLFPLYPRTARSKRIPQHHMPADF